MAATNSASMVQASNTNQGTPLSVASTAHLQAGGGSFTVGAFVKFSTLSAILHGIVTKWNDGNTSREYNLCYSNGTGQFLFFSNSGGGTDTYILGTTNVTTATWYHVVAGYDAGAGKLFLYVNGVSDATTVTAPQTQSSSSVFSVGSFQNNPAWATDGLIAMAFKYSSALTPTQITWLYNGGFGRSTAEILAHTGLTTPDVLYGFDNSGALGTDSGPNTITLAATFAAGPTQSAGPGTGAPTTVAVTGPSTLIEGTPGTYTATLGSSAVGGVEIQPVASGFSATFSPSGPITIANGAVSTTFTANSSTAGSGSVTVTSPGLTATPRSVTSSSSAPAVSPSTAPVNLGGTTTLTASGFTGSTVTWSSSNTGRVTVNSSTGVCTGVAAGAATITATGVSVNSQTATAVVTTATVAATVSPTSTTLGVTGTVQLSVTVTGAASTAVTYASSDTSVATVNSTGLVTGVAIGTATVTVTSAADGTKTATCAVTVGSAAVYPVFASLGATGLAGTAGFVVYSTDGSTYQGRSASVSSVSQMGSSGTYRGSFAGVAGATYLVVWDDGAGNEAPAGMVNPPVNVVAVQNSPAALGDGIASAAATSTITIPSSANLAGWSVRILSAAGKDEVAVIQSSNTSTGVQTLTAPWAVVPTGTIVYELDPPGTATVSGPVTLAASQPNYAPATASALSTLVTSVGSPAQASALSTLATATGTPAQASALSTLATAVGTPAQAAQIPGNFTTQTFSGPGVFSTNALAAAPTGGSAPTAAAIRAEMDSSSTKLANITGAVALASQIPGNFTTQTFSAPGVFSTAALAAGPSGTGSSPSAISATVTPAVVAAMANAPVGSVASLAGVQLSGGTVSASPTTTGFVATGNLNTTVGGYPAAPMSVFWQTGANAGLKYAITAHSVSSSNHTFAVTPAMVNTPQVGDTFVIV